jgi:hypothetical protein
MSEHRRGIRFVIAMILLLVIPAIAGRAAAQKPGSPPDLSGTWGQGGDMTNGGAGRGFSKDVPPLQPTAMKVYEANRAGLTSLNDKGIDELDPLTYCFPPGAVRSMIMPYSFEIAERPGVVYILFEFGSGIRRIYTDGRKHPDDLTPTWMGHSIGTWQGDTLVVDTVGLRPETWIDPTGVPHSDALHMVERFRRTKPDTLEVQFTFDDAKAFTHSWGGTRVYHPDQSDPSDYFVCEENLQVGKPPASPGAQ